MRPLTQAMGEVRSTYTNDDTAGNDEEHDNVSPQVIQSVTVEDAPIPLLKPRSQDKKRKDRDFDEELLEVLKSQSSMDEFEAFATGKLCSKTVVLTIRVASLGDPSIVVKNIRQRAARSPNAFSETIRALN
ncbi:unnamed protein product [Allacma fusca]|uniref:Uncharacterized protein n=1 Tax=Allacma fusca TaxID=39272 RepID=A0A8J2JTS0_9HEXA|nr:unnamed protein product [Allacma fusca]